MLQKETVLENLYDTIKELQRDKIFKDFILAGGTALALQIGHRKSDDIDLFTLRPILYDRLKLFLDKTYMDKIRYTKEDSESDFLFSFINNQKVDFLCYKQIYIEQPKTIDGIKIIGLQDIAALKLEAIAGKRNKAKDYADIYYLFNYFSLEQMFDFYKIKYAKNDIRNVRKALLLFDKVNEKSWDQIKYTKPISGREIKDTIRKKAEEYFEKHIEDIHHKKIEKKKLENNNRDDRR
jgi:hypothetical protein